LPLAERTRHSIFNKEHSRVCQSRILRNRFPGTRGKDMSDERLLEHIQNVESNPDSRVERDISRKVRSIINHLQNMLNTRQGSVMIADDYGIPDITNTHGEGINEMTNRIENSLQKAIEKYEPRLNNVRVQLLSKKEDVLVLRFKLEAVLVADNSTPVVLETVISPDGKVDVTD